MTIEELAALPSEVLTCQQVAPFLKCNPYTLNLTAKQKPQLLGFPVNVIGTRVRIPKQAFIRFLTGEN